MKLLKNSYWLKSGIYTFFQRFSVAFFGFINFYILVREFSIDEYGVYMLFVSVGSLLEVIRNGFIRNALVKHLSSCEEAEKIEISSASLMLNILLTLLMVLFLILFAETLSIFWSSPQLQSLFYIYILTNLTMIAFSHLEYIQQAHFSFKGIFYGHFVRRGLFFSYILVTFLFSLEITLNDLAYFDLFAVVIGTAVSFYFCKSYLNFSFKMNLQWFKKLFHFGKYTFGTNISTMVFKNIDQWMLGRMVSPAAVAIYNPALRVSNLVEVPTLSVSSIVFPKMSQRILTEGEGAAKYLYEKSVGLIMAIMLPVIFFIILFADYVILFIADDKYLETVPILQITIFYTIFIPFSRQFGVILDAIGKPKINFYFVVINAVLNVISNYFFINAFGLMGAAYGTLLTYGVGFLIIQTVLKVQLKVKTFNVFRYAWNFYIDGYQYILGIMKNKIISEKQKIK